MLAPDQLDPDYYNNMKYGRFFDAVALELALIIKHSSELLNLDISQLPALDTWGRSFVGLPELRIVNSNNFSKCRVHNHLWLEFSLDGQEEKLAIGELIEDPKDSVGIEQAKGFKDRIESDKKEKKASDGKKEVVATGNKQENPATPATTDKDGTPVIIEAETANQSKKNNHSHETTRRKKSRRKKKKTAKNKKVTPPKK